MRPITSRRGAWRLSLLLVCCGVPLPGLAQAGGLLISTGRVMDERGDVQGGVTVAPSVSWRSDRAVAGVAAQGTRFNRGNLLGTGSAWGRAVIFVRGPVAAVLGAEGSMTGATGGYRVMAGALRPTVQVGRRGWALEAGPHMAHARERASGLGGPGGSSRRLFGSAPVSPAELRTRSALGWGAGGWMSRGPVSLHGGWRNSSLDESTWQEWTAEGIVSVGRARLGARTGARLGDLDEEWLAGWVEAPLSRGVTVALEAGRTPTTPLIQRRAGRYISAGVKLTSEQGRNGK